MNTQMIKPTLILIATLLFSNSCFAQWEAYLERNGIRFNASTDNFTILNNFDAPLPEVQQKLYKLADSILASNPQGTYRDLASNPLFVNFCKANSITHLGGPMLGNITSEGVDIWVRTALPASVVVKIDINGKEKSFAPVNSTIASDLTAIVKLRGLDAGTQYNYAVYVNNEKIKTSSTPHFQTLSDNTQASTTRIAFGSCLHRCGLGNEKQAQTIVNRSPNALLLMGDIAAQDRKNHAGQHSLDYLMRDLFPAWQNIASHVATYATWDDHDYFDNDLYGVPPGFTQQDKTNVWNVFHNAWNNPMYGFGKEGEAVFFRTKIQNADVIMVDNRALRSDTSLLGEPQMQWLEAQLLDCKEPFIILSCGSMWSDYLSNGKDSWGAFDPKGRERIFNFIEKNNIKGVLLISGDRHGARGFKIPRPSGFNFYEFGAASMGGLYGPPDSNPAWTTQLYGVSRQYAFGEFTINTATKDPTVTFRLIEENGVILHEMTISRSELTPRK